MPDVEAINGRVTNALILQRLEVMDEKIDNILDCQHEHGKRIHDSEVHQAANDELHKSIGKDISRLETKSNSWDLINTTGAVVSGILAGLGLGK
jgi:hypothetical protein